MKIIDTEILEKIQEMAGHFLSVREIAYLLKIDFNILSHEINNPDSSAHFAYHLGVTTSKYELRRKVIQLAKMGSPQAEILAEKYMEEQQLIDDE